MFIFLGCYMQSLKHVPLFWCQVEWYNKLNELLTQNNEVMTQDRRFSIKRRYVDEWVLSINNVRNSDAGRYECRIGPYKSHSVELIVSSKTELQLNS